MLTAYATVLAFLAVAWAFVFGATVMGKLRRAAPPAPRTGTVLEPRQPGTLNFDPRYLRIALAVVIFDVAIALLYPIAAVFKGVVASGHGARAFGEISGFVFMVLFGLAYLTKKGDLE
jgi:NADH-quinone oxidoreductase subunit A